MKEQWWWCFKGKFKKSVKNVKRFKNSAKNMLIFYTCERSKIKPFQKIWPLPLAYWPWDGSFKFENVYFKPFDGGNGVEWRFVINENLMDEKRMMKPKGKINKKVSSWWISLMEIFSFWWLGVGLCVVKWWWKIYGVVLVWVMFKQQMIKVFVLELLMTFDDGGQGVLVASFKKWVGGVQNKMVD